MVLEHNLNPIFLNLFGLQIHWYGLMYVIGLLAGYFILSYFAKQGQLKLTEDEVLDFMVYLALGLLLGSRIFYFIFYNFSQVLQNPLSLFAIWKGGMSFHGGVIGVMTSGYIFCRKYKKSFMHIADYVTLPLTLGLGLGRIGNFINGELFGRATSLPWAMNFGDNIPRHPSQLYEAAKNFTMTFFFWFIRNKHLPEGFRFWLFIFFYGVLRFTIEFVRQPDPQLGFIFLNFTMGQVLCSVMVLVGGCMLWFLYNKHTKQQ